MLSAWCCGVNCEIHIEAYLVDRDWAKPVVRFLWLQQALQEGRLKVLSVPTGENLSDTLTKSFPDLTCSMLSVYDRPPGQR